MGNSVAINKSLKHVDNYFQENKNSKLSIEIKHLFHYLNKNHNETLTIHEINYFIENYLFQYIWKKYSPNIVCPTIHDKGKTLQYQLTFTKVLPNKEMIKDGTLCLLQFFKNNCNSSEGLINLNDFYTSLQNIFYTLQNPNLNYSDIEKDLIHSIFNPFHSYYKTYFSNNYKNNTLQNKVNDYMHYNHNSELNKTLQKCQVINNHNHFPSYLKSNLFLNCKEGKILTILNNFGYCYYVENIEKEEKGFIPCHFIRLLEDEEVELIL
ncbi:hypothetical protein ABK040_010717 [Willaertia magna]